MVHVAALNMTFLPTFLKGGTSVLMTAWSARGCLDLIRRWGVTFLFGVPTMYADLESCELWPDAEGDAADQALRTTLRFRRT